ncbi:MAG: prepilin-type N-terminal cleavage/methylation domain-containing protein [Patescibacteria group bacterium]|nr:prepilin-type N-terminal cleavage/methylation domain-containing protein [Patescibacteria group bacterium]
MIYKNGFSLIEVLVSISIFALITTSLVANFRGGETKNQLNLAASNTVAELRKAQSMTQAGQPTRVCLSGDQIIGNCEANPSCAGTCVENVPVGGWGLVFTSGSDKMKLFANSELAVAFDESEEQVSELPVSPTGRVKISGITTDTGPVNTLVVYFRPPVDRIVFAGDVALNPTNATIVLEHMTSGATRIIKINNISGRIDVE